MDHSTYATAAVIGGMLVGFGLVVVLPIVAVLSWARVAVKRAADRHVERMAMIERGVAPSVAEASPAETPEGPGRTLGWAVGLLVCGVLSTFVKVFPAMLVGVGAAYLTRGIIGLRRGAGGPGSPGGGRP